MTSHASTTATAAATTFVDIERGVQETSLTVVENPSEDDTALCCVGGCCGMMLIGFCSALPIAELIIASTYKNDITGCTENFGISIYDWLMIKGIVEMTFIGIYAITYALIMAFSPKTNDNAIIGSSFVLVSLTVVASVFIFVWIIIGSIIFWRDCDTITPNQVNNLMWVTLIISYVSMITHVRNKGKNEK